MSNINPKSKIWLVVTYPDSETHFPFDKCVENLTIVGASYIACLHDKDYDADGNLKKPHYHWFVVFKTDRHLSIVKTIFGVSYAEMPNSTPEASARYLLHLDSFDKTHYPRECLLTNLDSDDVDLWLTSPPSDVVRARVKAEQEKSKTESLLDDIEKLAWTEICYRDFLSKYPQFIYKMKNLFDLLECVRGFLWSDVPPDTGVKRPK